MIRNPSLLGLAALALAACANEPTKPPMHDHSTHAHEASAPASPSPTPAAKGYREITPSTSYPLKTCVVTGDKLGSMGDPIAIEYQGQEVQFCCDGCVDEFMESPDKFLPKVREAGKR